jgi:tetratricopeptide (TPR) repeat protein/tRNA A-37 threonylcarbamoyl transferase component Bud32
MSEYGDSGSASVDETLVGTLGEGAVAYVPEDQTREPEPGSVVGRYVVEARIGMGSMGTVYRARDPKLGRDIALKLLRVDRKRNRADASARVLREAQAIARLNHPNVVVVNDVGQLDDQVFIAMELVRGETLSKWLTRQRRSWRDIVAALRQAGEGLAAAHAADLVHRDFKPDNVLVGDDGRVRVLDFGLARPTSTTSRDDTAPEFVAASHLEPADPLSSIATRVSGTPAYMAPEQFKLLPVGPHADQFSFCVALWEALFEQRPFQGDSYATIGAAVTLGRRRGPPQETEVPQWLVEVLDRGLAVDPNDRWPSMRDLLDQLRVDTSRSRATLAWSAWFAGGVAVCLGAWAVGSRDDEATCSGSEERLAAAWGPSTKARVGQAFTDSALPFAADTWTTLEGELDAYARAWIDAREDACAATQLRKEQSQALMTARMDCLAVRQRALESLTSALVTPTDEAIGGALEAARGLPAIASCSDPAYVTAAVPPPVEASLQAEVETIRTRIARARSASALGDIEGALAAMRAAQADAQRLDYMPVQLEAALALGHLEETSGNFAPAEALLRDAFFGAVKLGANDLAAEAATALIVVVGDRLGRFDEAREWIRHAEAALDASGGDRTELWIAHGGFLLRTGELDAADALYAKARARIEATGTPHQRASICDDIGVLHSDRGQYDEARTLHERAFEIRERDLGPNHPDIAASLQRLANVDQLSGRYDAAVENYDRARAILVRVHGGEGEPLGGLYHNLGRLQFIRGDLDAALPNLEKSVVVLERYKGPDHPTLATALNALGATLRKLGRIDEAMVAVQRAESILSRALGPDSIDRASVLTGLANIYDLQGRLDEALQHYEEAERIFEAGLGPEHPMVAILRTNRALLHLKLDQPGRGVTLTEEAVALLESSLGAEHPDLAAPLSAQGQALIDDGRPNEAVAPLRRALELQDSNGVSGQQRGETEITLAKSLWAVGERKEAAALADAAAKRFAENDATESLARLDAWRERNGLRSR